MRTVAALCLAATAGAAVHEERLAQISNIKATPGVLWTAKAHPRFAAEAPGASKSLCGVKGNWKATVEAAIARGDVHRFQAIEDVEIPESFDSAEEWPQCAKSITDIRDQSNCGCCWAFAGAEAASDRMCIASNGTLLMPLSDEDVCFCASDDGCGGGMIDVPWLYIKESGSVTGGQFQGSGPFGKGFCANFELPHCHHHGPQGKDPFPAEGQPGCESQKSRTCPTHCDAGASQAHSDFAADKLTFRGKIVSASGEKEIQQMIMAGGPVETAFTVYSDFENYAGGIYHHVTGEQAGGHAVKFRGWGVENGVKYWTVANSWNPYWGEGGLFRIRRGNNEGGIEDAVTGSDHTATWGRKAELETLVVV